MVQLYARGIHDPASHLGMAEGQFCSIHLQLCRYDGKYWCLCVEEDPTHGHMMVIAIVCSILSLLVNCTLTNTWTMMTAQLYLLGSGFLYHSFVFGHSFMGTPSLADDHRTFAVGTVLTANFCKLKLEKKNKFKIFIRIHFLRHNARRQSRPCL